MSEPEPNRKQTGTLKHPQPEPEVCPSKEHLPSGSPCNPPEANRNSGDALKLTTTAGVAAAPNGRAGGARGEAAYRGPRLALSKTEAAAALGISVDSFERYVQSELRLIRRGRLRLVPMRELERWLDSNAARTLEDVR
jgi:hypothetical protein